MRLPVAVLLCLLLAAPAASAWPLVPTPPYGSPPPSQPPGTCDPTTCSFGAISIAPTVACLPTMTMPPATTCVFFLGPGCSGPPVPLVPFAVTCSASATATVLAWTANLVDVPANLVWVLSDGQAFAMWAADYAVCDLVLGSTPPCPL